MYLIPPWLRNQAHFWCKLKSKGCFLCLNSRRTVLPLTEAMLTRMVFLLPFMATRLPVFVRVLGDPR